jgi:hypothetical protein
MKFRELSKKNVAVFSEKTAVAWMKPSGRAGSHHARYPGSKTGWFREGSRRMTPSSSAQITVHGFAFALISKPDLSVRPLKI